MGHWFFIFMPPTKKSQICMPPCFMPPPQFLCHPSNLKSLCHSFLCQLNISVFQRKIKIQRGISTFLAHFFHSPPFFYATHFYATLKKNEIFMPPPFYATLENLMPPFLCHPGGGIKKRGGGIKEKKQCVWVDSDQKCPIFLFFMYLIGKLWCMLHKPVFNFFSGDYEHFEFQNSEI